MMVFLQRLFFNQGPSFSSLAFGVCILLGGTMTECTTPEPVLKLIGSNIGVVGKSLTLTWNLTLFSNDQTPSKAFLLVAHTDTPNTLVVLRKASFSNGKVTYAKMKIDTTKPESIFNNITDMKNEGKTKFQLIITSVPSNIKSFIFTCRVSYVDVWMSASADTVSVQLASKLNSIHFLIISIVLSQLVVQ